jgi:hypothetical protein
MTHFVSLIVVPKEIWEGGETEVREYIDSQMWPYSEEHQVEPYVEYTKKEAKKKMREHVTWLKQEIRKKEDEEYKKQLVFYSDKKTSWAEKVRKYFGCEVNSKGDVLETFNRDSFWDWYRIGGRWDGILTGNRRDSEDGFNFSDEHESLSNNSVRAKELLRKFRNRCELVNKYREGAKQISSEILNNEMLFSCFGFADIMRSFFDGEEAVVKLEDDKWRILYGEIMQRFGEQIRDYEFCNPFITGIIIDKDGQCRQGKSYGWWGTSRNVKDMQEWEREFEKILEESQDAYVVNLDCHV